MRQSIFDLCASSSGALERAVVWDQQSRLEITLRLHKPGLWWVGLALPAATSSCRQSVWGGAAGLYKGSGSIYLLSIYDGKASWGDAG